jgi:hypothetical protein
MHMLAVYSCHTATKAVSLSSPSSSRTHCVNLPILPASSVVCLQVAGSTISVPVVPLCIPALDIFPQLSTFLYTKRVNHLLVSLHVSESSVSLYTHTPSPLYLYYTNPFGHDNDTISPPPNHFDDQDALYPPNTRLSLYPHLNSFDDDNSAPLCTPHPIQQQQHIISHPSCTPHHFKDHASSCALVALPLNLSYLKD